MIEAAAPVNVANLLFEFAFDRLLLALDKKMKIIKVKVIQEISADIIINTCYAEIIGLKKIISVECGCKLLCEAKCSFSGKFEKI